MGVGISLDAVRTTFFKSIDKLKSDIEFQKRKGAVSPRFISVQENIVRSFEAYQKEAEATISKLQWDIVELSKGKVEDIERLKREKLCLEAICITHGVTDFVALMGKGRRFLVTEAVTAHKEGSVQIPHKLMCYLGEMEKCKRTEIMDLFFEAAKKYNETESVNEQ